MISEIFSAPDMPPRLPTALQQLAKLHLQVKEVTGAPVADEAGEKRELSALFPLTSGQPSVHFVEGTPLVHRPLRVGVVFSGGQAPGGHNVIAGLFDALHILHAESQLFGFLGGPNGILKQHYIEITAELLQPFRNQGGFDLLGSGRTKIATRAQFEAAAEAVQSAALDGLVIVGGDDSNTNATQLAEFFLDKQIATRVIGVPKTIDGDLKSEHIECSFGFDTASKLYAHLIGNIQRDALSAKKYYHFIKLMGRTASHITLECALQTHPNYALIGEEVAAGLMTLKSIVAEIATLIEARAQAGKEYGVILVPEGLLEFIPECKILIQELNGKLKGEEIEGLSIEQKLKVLEKELSHTIFSSLPVDIQKQLLLDRDPHGNVNVSKIESERLLIQLVANELARRAERSSQGHHGHQGLKFNAQPHFFGYEGRCCPPSCFDANYTYALGFVAALLVDRNVTGYMAALTHLDEAVEEWQIGGVPLFSLLTFEERNGKRSPVIQKALVDLEGPSFLTYKTLRSKWGVDDDYRYPGPIQYFGPRSITDACTLSLSFQAASLK